MTVGYFAVGQIRDAEAELFTRVPDGTPMRRAAWGLASIVGRELKRHTGSVSGRRVGLLVGSGDNGGDALWAGAFLRRRGVAVDAVVLQPERVHSAGFRALLDAGGRVVNEFGTGVQHPDLVLDGIVGISGQGPLRPKAAQHVERITAPIIAVDLPSGVDPNTGSVSGPAVKATMTVTFGALKPVHALASAMCGQIELVPIGLSLPEPSIIELTDADVGQHWPVPGPADHKYSLGVTGVLAGSAKYPGAAVLCAGGAIAAKSGMVRFVGSAAPSVVGRFPEAIATDSYPPAGRVDAWVVGPGFGVDDAARRTLVAVLERNQPTVLDADALTVLAGDTGVLKGRTAALVVTPHAREFARLAGTEPSGDRVDAAQELAENLSATVLLKGNATVVATPHHSTGVVVAHSSWAATPGTGDVLAGVIGALLGANLNAHQAAMMGAHVHALAARIGAGSLSLNGEVSAGNPISASALLTALPLAIRYVRAAATQT
ncbi:NAD(P)H-hydrate dehydratase [Hoyosella rhizosphaerae]|nr:NAD(P)H-hydrate dehydratase [Hoyosella rhizosphaerae]MBN4926165.1 NAD(P)H-hydrate dehydratase [Hoyosella rhizosphaerae]